MNESVSRLIEAERRIARSESELRNLSTKLAGVRQDLRNRSQNPINQIRTVTGGGGGGMHRFATQYEIWVEWDTVPTLKTGASSNPTADVTSLAEAVSDMEVGYLLSVDNISSYSSLWHYDPLSSALFQQAAYEFADFNWSTLWSLVKWDGGNFLIDSAPNYLGTDIDEYSLSPISDSRFNLSVTWNRRNGIGTIIGSDTLVAMRTSLSEDEHTFGPTYGDSGEWSFAMACAETTRHNAGSGTIFLRWGTSVPSIVSGGTPDSLPTDIIDGGGPGSLPTDIIDGGTI